MGSPLRSDSIRLDIEECLARRPNQICTAVPSLALVLDHVQQAIEDGQLDRALVELADKLQVTLNISKSGRKQNGGSCTVSGRPPMILAACQSILSERRRRRGRQRRCCLFPTSRPANGNWNLWRRRTPRRPCALSPECSAKEGSTSTYDSKKPDLIKVQPSPAPIRHRCSP